MTRHRAEKRNHLLRRLRLLHRQASIKHVKAERLFTFGNSAQKRLYRNPEDLSNARMERLLEKVKTVLYRLRFHLIHRVKMDLNPVQ
jgi:hypothetical protein